MQPKPDTTLHQLRRVSRRLHVLFAQAMSAAENPGVVSPDAAELARRMATLSAFEVDDEHDAGETPLGRPSAVLLLRRALSPGSASLLVAVRAGNVIDLLDAVFR